MDNAPQIMLEKPDLLDLYKTTVSEQRSCAEDHHKRVVWFISILSTLGAATLAGVFKATLPEHYLVLLVGPAAMVFVSGIAQHGTRRIYQRFLECIEFRAKIEYRLGLMNANKDNSDSHLNYLGREPMISSRHIADFEKVVSAEQWRQKCLAEGYQKHALNLFRQSQFIGILLCAAILCMATYRITEATRSPRVFLFGVVIGVAIYHFGQAARRLLSNSDGPVLDL
jgi:hypothetical protein